MEQNRIINKHHVFIGGTWYEISTPKGDGVIHAGNCIPIATPREVYERHFPRPQGDGKLLEKVTLLYTGDMGNCLIRAEYARLDVSEIRPKQDGYELRCSCPGSNDCIQILWPVRPSILVANGYLTDWLMSGIPVVDRSYSVYRTEEWKRPDHSRLKGIAAQFDMITLPYSWL